MSSSTDLQGLLRTFTERARLLGMTDSAWAARAGMPKETLSRLRRRTSCDFASIVALADAVAMRLTAVDIGDSHASSDSHFPSTVDRDYEERLVELCTSRNTDPSRWAKCGPPFFMAGLAVMVASMSGFDRRALLACAENLHPGAGEPAVFQRWLDSSPVRPSRFLPMIAARVSHAA